MGHWTAYVLRLADGSCHAMGEKMGDWYLAKEGDRDRVTASILRKGMGVTDDRARDLVGGWFCRGVALDFATRRYRYFNRDEAWQQGVGYVESAVRRLASAPEWAGWEVDYAWGEHADLVEIVPEAAPAVADDDEDVREKEPLETVLPSRDGWFAGWDPVQRELTVLNNAQSIIYFGNEGNSVVSIVNADDTVLDYQLEVWNVAAFLADQEQSLVAGLSAHAPYPLVYEELVSSGAVIDVPARRLRYWTRRSVPPRLRAKLAAAWPGWSVERLPLGYPGHVAATGHLGDEDLIATDAYLRTRGWTEDLLEIRNDRRAAFSQDRGSLRPPRVRVIEG